MLNLLEIKCCLFKYVNDVDGHLYIYTHSIIYSILTEDEFAIYFGSYLCFLCR